MAAKNRRLVILKVLRAQQAQRRLARYAAMRPGCCICLERNFDGENADERFYEGLDPQAVNGKLIRPCGCKGTIIIHVACLGRVIYTGRQYPTEIPICIPCQQRYQPDYILDTQAYRPGPSSISMMFQYAMERLRVPAQNVLFFIVMGISVLALLSIFVNSYADWHVVFNFIYLFGLLYMLVVLQEVFFAMADEQQGFVLYNQWLINQIGYRRVHLNPNAFP